MNKALRAFVAVLAICVAPRAIGAAAKEAASNPRGKPTTWDDFNTLELKMTSPQGRGYAAWRVQIDKESVDVQVDTETNDGNKSKRGRILVVGGRVMATRGPITEPGFEIDALDAPILEAHLLTQLLGRSLPDGPSSVQGTRQIDFTEDKTGIQFATPSAQGFIPAPWHVKGDVKSVGADGVEFKLTLTVDRQGVPASQAHALDATFAGRLSRAASVRIDDTMSLDGWTLLSLGAQTRNEGGHTTSDYGAAPLTSVYKTVADIRKRNAAEDVAGEPDPPKN